MLMSCASEPTTVQTVEVDPGRSGWMPAAGEAVQLSDLKTALLPRETAQPVDVSILEERTTETHEGVRATHRMTLRRQGELSRTGAQEDGTVLAAMTLHRVRLHYGQVDPERRMFAYDSQEDATGKENPLADLMSIVAESEIRLRVSDEGRLIEVSGLDARWRGAGVLMAPPALLQAQWTFRDIPMRYLLAEALFPALPGRSLEVNDTWSSEEAIYVAVVSRLIAETRNTLSELHAFKQDGDARIRCTIKQKAEFRPAAPILENRPPSLETEVRQGTGTGTLDIVPETGDMEYTFKRRLDLAVYQVPPEGDRSPPMTIQQRFEVQAKRGRPVTRRIP